jgi:predicted enzyme related to lactoylglutathione lyase
MKSKIFLILALTTSFAFGFAFNTIITGQMNSQPEAKKVTGIGGIFFKCKDPKQLKAWYAKNLGLKTSQYGTMFEWREYPDTTKKGITQWTPFPQTTKYFDPSTKDFMINYRVENLQLLVEGLRKEGVTVVDTIETYDYGKFVHIMDIEGNKIELWEPPAGQ